MRALLLVPLLVGCAQSNLRHARPLDRAIEEGVAFLVRDQQPDGSWGAGGDTTPWDLADDVPGAHHAFRDATTALCVMALRAAGEHEARERGLRFLIQKRYARRSSPGQIYNVWAHCYVTQALATELQHDPDNAALREACAAEVRMLDRFQTYVGGWNYYDNNPAMSPSSLDPTSFTTAAGLVGLWEARRAGVEVPDEMPRRAIRRVEQSRFPNGAYGYGFDDRLHPSSPASKMQGAIGRSQACNDALWLWTSVDEAAVVAGLEAFFEYHKFILIGRKRQYPHEAWFATAPYYYYFGHYYAGRLIGRLPTAERERFVARYLETILPYQEPGGEWWDYPMWDYHQPYGTAFAILGLIHATR